MNEPTPEQKMIQELQSRVAFLERQMEALAAGRPCPTIGPDAKCATCGAEIPGYSGGPPLCADCIDEKAEPAPTQ